MTDTKNGCYGDKKTSEKPTFFMNLSQATLHRVARAERESEGRLEGTKPVREGQEVVARAGSARGPYNATRCFNFSL